MNRSARIEAADARLSAAQIHVASPKIVSDATALTAALAEVEAAQVEHDALMERWVELSEKAGATCAGCEGECWGELLAKEERSEEAL